jgi:hypothetical protein
MVSIILVCRTSSASQTPTSCPKKKKEEEQRQKTQPSPVYIVGVTPLTKMETKKCVNILRRRGWESHARPAWTPRTQGNQKKTTKEVRGFIYKTTVIRRVG